MDFLFGLPKDLEGNTGIAVFVNRLSKMDHLAAVPNSIDAEATAKQFIDRVFDNMVRQWQLFLIEIPASLGSFGSPSSRCSAPVWTCSQRIIRRPMVKLSVLIALLMTFCAVFALIRLCVGAPCSLFLSLRCIPLFMPLQAILCST